MAKWGNALTIFNSNDAVISEVKQLLTGLGAKYERIESTFFVESTSQENTRIISVRLGEANIIHTMIFLHHTGANWVLSKHIDRDQLERIRKLIIK